MALGSGEGFLEIARTGERYRVPWLDSPDPLRSSRWRKADELPGHLRGRRRGGGRLRGVARDQQVCPARVLRVVLPRVTAPEPSEHLGHDRTGPLLGMCADTP